MAGLTPGTLMPSSIVLHRQSRVLELHYPDGRGFRLPFEFLRVYSPSAEVRVPGPSQGTLQTGKREVSITGLEPVGLYALRPLFSDGHDSGIYSWDYLHDLATRQETLWQAYLDQLAASRLDRDAPMPTRAAHGSSH